MFYSLQIKDNRFYDCHQFENWDDFCRFLVINLSGTPESISIDIMDIFSKISEDTNWVNTSRRGYDIVDNHIGKMIIWNSNIVNMRNVVESLNDRHRSVFIESFRNMKIDLIDHKD